MKRPIDALTAHGLAGCQPVSQQSMPTAREARLRYIAAAIERVVQESYKQHPMAHRTDAEDARRASICTGWFNRLVNDDRWTPDRALSAMRIVLDDTLSGRAPAVTRKKKGGLWLPDKTLIRGLA